MSQRAKVNYLQYKCLYSLNYFKREQDGFIRFVTTVLLLGMQISGPVFFFCIIPFYLQSVPLHLGHVVA
jgi:hypothetical protein